MSSFLVNIFCTYCSTLSGIRLKYYAVEKVLTFESADEILRVTQSEADIEQYCDAVYYAVQGGSNFCVCG